ncbi:hypothetical protein RCL_jg25612.t1 [Rhizophagus clarus]|uniref:Uncharacterized protein n=1 Tax=Rhizophagus clarus TaxID=94130 RepID=A0A8H3LMW8_9GLOM|nr:hypothetical protein RCL_jg25612.t1 [Rhizophagus clarus]
MIRKHRNCCQLLYGGVLSQSNARGHIVNNIKITEERSLLRPRRKIYESIKQTLLTKFTRLVLLYTKYGILANDITQIFTKDFS